MLMVVVMLLLLQQYILPPIMYHVVSFFHCVSLFCTMSYHFSYQPIPFMYYNVYLFTSSRHQLEKTSGDDDDDDQCRRVTYRRSMLMMISVVILQLQQKQLYMSILTSIIFCPCFPSFQFILYDKYHLQLQFLITLLHHHQVQRR